MSFPKVISQAYTERGVEYYREFAWKERPSAGFCFPSDSEGNVNLDALAPAGRENYEKCRLGTYDVDDLGVKERRWRYRHPKVIECESCRLPVTLGAFTNTCECGADYNASGWRLAPRECWGEETGEHWTECI